MKLYNKIQFNQMVKRYQQEFGESEINNWSDYYQSMKTSLQTLKRLNKLNEVKSETEAILEYCNQHRDKSNIIISISILSFTGSIISIIFAMYLEIHPEIFEVNINTIIIILTFFALLIQLIVLMNMKFSIKLQNDAVYFKCKLNLIEEITSFQNEV